jgi:hypothetical protein
MRAPLPALYRRRMDGAVRVGFWLHLDSRQIESFGELGKGAYPPGGGDA